MVSRYVSLCTKIQKTLNKLLRFQKVQFVSIPKIAKYLKQEYLKSKNTDNIFEILRDFYPTWRWMISLVLQ